jgi:hypothetical protein
MGFEMERKLVKLIDEISVHARDLSAIAEKQMLMREDGRREMQQQCGGSGMASTALDMNENGLGSYSPEKNGSICPDGEKLGEEQIERTQKKKGKKRGVLYRENKGGKDRVVQEKEQHTGSSSRNSGVRGSLNHAGGTIGGGKVHGAELLMMLKDQLFQGAREGKLFKVTQVVGTKLMDVSATKDEEGNTALMIAVMNAHLDVAEYIATRGRDKIVNAQNLEGNTALHYSLGNEPMTKMLKSYGANPSIRNMYGLLPSQGGAPKSFADFEGLM